MATCLFGVLRLLDWGGGGGGGGGRGGLAPNYHLQADLKVSCFLWLAIQVRGYCNKFVCVCMLACLHAFLLACFARLSCLVFRVFCCVFVFVSLSAYFICGFVCWLVGFASWNKQRDATPTMHLFWLLISISRLSLLSPFP